MSESGRDDVDLPEGAESLLADWPMAERDEAAWEALAGATLAAAQASSTPTDEALLAPPLPREDDEPATPEHEEPAAADGAETQQDAAPEPPAPSGKSGSEAPKDDGLGLADIARAAVATKKPTDDADLIRQSLSVAASARHSVPEIAEAEATSAEQDADDEGTPVTDVQTVRSGSGAPVDAQSSGAARPRVVQLPSAEPGRGSGRAGLIVAGLLAAAAALVLVVRSREPAEPLAVSLDRASEPLVAEGARELAPAPAERPAEQPSKDEPQFLALDDLPTEAEAKRREREAEAEAKAEPRGNVVASKRAAPAAITLAEEAPNPAAAPTQKGGGFETDPAMKPAAQATDLPSRPSTGAVQAAVASVMTGAQMCLAGQEEGAKATLTFGSDGKVTAVSVGGPAEACIKAALSRAKVSPFAEPTFSARFTVRPP